MNSSHWDVILVGGGLVGASTALALAQRHPALAIALVDANPPPPATLPAGFDPRVVALNAASQEFLTELGVWQALPRPCPYLQMQVWDGEGTGSLGFSAAELHSPSLGQIVENRALVQALWRALEALPNVQLLAGRRVEALQLGAQPLGTLSLDKGEPLQAPVILAADGAQSPLREMAGIPSRRWAYGQTALVTTVQTELPHGFTAWQRFAQHGPLAFLPLSENAATTASAHGSHYSSIVWSLDEAQAQAMFALDDDAFCQALGRAFEHRLGAVTQTDPRLAIPLHQCHARQYYKPGFALLGDAAHSIHPLAGQGVNLGLADAQVLCAELSRALTRGIGLGDPSVLARYQRQRMGHNLAAMAAMEGLKRLFGQPGLAMTLLRNTGLRQVDHWPWLKQQFMQLARGA